MTDELRDTLKSLISVSCDVVVCEPETVPRSLGRAQCAVDKRG
ncbi:MAG: hypothetical protein OET44_21020 [Gammaproteobacteria bacterium]|nr:hypothetical protein [Gammaproteobacteria bacterium]